MDDKSVGITLQVLLVEDNPTDALLLEDALEQVRGVKIMLTVVKRLDEALARLQAEYFDAVLLDLGLPDSSGLETFTRTQNRYPSVPILVLSGLDDETLAVTAVRDGAQDYLVKGTVDSVMLVRTIRYAIGRKRTADRLTAADLGYRRLFETARDGIFLLDAETGKITDANPFFHDLLGYPLTEFIGKRLWEIAPFRGKAASKAAFRTLQEKGYISYENLPLITRDGRSVDVEFVSNVYAVGDQQVIQCNIRDITERKRAEAGLRESEARKTAIFETALDCIISMDDTGRVLEFNPAAEETFGYRRDECIGQLLSDLIMPPAVREQHHRGLEHFLATGEGPMIRNRVEVSAMRADSTEFMAELSISPVHLGDRTIFTGYLRDITERRRAEQQIRMHSHLLDVIGQAVVVTDCNGTITYWNQFAQKLYGWSSSEALGRNILDVTPTDTTQQQAKEILAALAQGQSWSGEFVAQRRNGTKFPAHVTDTPVLDEAGQVISIIGISFDITERKQTEAELRESEEKFQSIVANVPGMVYQFALHPNGAISWPFVSDGCQEMFEVEAESIKQNPSLPLDMIHPDDRDEFNRSMRVAKETLVPWSWQGRLRMRSGKIKWIQGASHPQLLPEGGTVCTGLFMDITARKEAEEERDRFFTLSLDMLAIISSDGYIKRLNPAFEATLGFSDAELLAVPFIDFVHPEDRAITEEGAARLINGLPVTHFENRYRCRDGSYKWLRWTCAPFEELWYCVAHDVTEAKQSAAALLQANDKLELRVMERTAELAAANQEMAAARQEADAANLAKSEFLSRMSHELRTPLNAVLGFGQILEKQELTPLSKESVGYILKGGRHLLDLINEVLDITRVETGHLDLSLEPIALNVIVPDVCALVRPLAAEHDITLSDNLEKLGGSYVLADLQRLKQVLINLLSNAIKYNREGGQVEVSCEQKRDGWISIAVRDTGPGISPEDLPKLFTPFERLSAASTAIEGTGLGLVLSQRLVTAMGGTLSVQSTLGQGSTFTLELPQAAAPDEQVLNVPQATHFLHTDKQSEHLYSVLCIEDNPSNLRLMETIFDMRPSIDLLAAIQGSVGLDMARQHEPNLILLDLDLPDIHGSEVLTRLQQSALTRDIPVVVVSADATPKQIERLLAAGAKAYLTKPLDVGEFLNTVDEFLQGTPASVE